jgi:1-acyl-sn-glycerol-3-phosphate acyltransferase
MKRLIEAVNADGPVILFPEGTRTRDGNLQRARSGIGLIVIKSDAPVVPVRVWGTFDAFGRHVRLPKPKRITVKYGELMEFRELRAEAASCGKERLKEIYRQVAEEIMAAIAKLEPKKD